MSLDLKAEASKPTVFKSETRLTFGLEIEYLLATIKPNLPNPFPKDPRQLDGETINTIGAANADISKRLKNVGIPASVLDEECEECGVTDEGFLTDWILKHDCSVGSEQPIHPDLKEFGLEMSSPPYYYDEGSREAIRTVIKVLRTNYLVRVNKSTGIHVHVGNENDGFQLPILRNLLAILFTYERQIRLILPDDRAQVDNYWSLPLIATKFAAKYIDSSRLEVLNHLLSFQDNNELIRSTQSRFSGSPGFLFDNLWLPYDDTGKRTIEYRIHHGSLDPEAILHWVHLCVKLTQKACLIKNQEELEAQLRKHVDKPVGLGKGDVSTIDFLMWIDCPSEAYYYGRNMVRNQYKLQQRIEGDEEVAALSVQEMKNRLRADYREDGGGEDVEEGYDEDDEED